MEIQPYESLYHTINSALITVLHFALIVKPSIVRKTHTYMYKVHMQLPTMGYKLKCYIILYV